MCLHVINAHFPCQGMKFTQWMRVTRCVCYSYAFTLSIYILHCYMGKVHFDEIN